ncbi:hypothetical protein [Sulfitobacter sp.]|jgi:hypothetical protein|uniref:hypothetical protein n=1 Tax=Sulfitobacter sp. TaxID=1903071 RepID=UPI003EFA71D4
MLNFRMPVALLVLALMPYGGAGAQEGLSSLGAIGGARAFSGHEIEFGETRFTLRGVTCPDPTTEDGKRAKALANTFLRMRGVMGCETSNGSGDCVHRSPSGVRNLSEVMLKTKLCWAGEA